MSKDRVNERFRKIKDIDLDKALSIGENRKPNNVGLYRMNCLVVGKTGSGKTTAILKTLLTDAIDNFKLLMFLIPRESYDSGFYSTLSKSKIPGKELVFIIIGENDLPSVQTLNALSKKIKGPMAIVLDDFINAFKKDDWLLFKRYVTQLSRVKYGASLFALTQNLLEFPTTYRKNFNSFCLFVNSLTLLQFKEIMRSYYDYGNLNKEQLEKIYNVFKQDLHTPLWLFNNSNPKESMIYDYVYITPEELLSDKKYSSESSEEENSEED
jgi:hypothetical protein